MSEIVDQASEILDRQKEASLLGMWVFLVTELLFFGGLFTCYTVYRYAHPQAFAEASQRLDVWLGCVNTAVLIASSFTMAMAVRFSETGEIKKTAVLLLLTASLGSVFLGIKGLEYFHKFEEHLVPGAGFAAPAFKSAKAEIFFSFYFVMTGVHALHMAAGIGVLGAIALAAPAEKLHSSRSKTVEIAGLYWHFVDIVWIFLFPLLYLIARA